MKTKSWSNDHPSQSAHVQAVSALAWIQTPVLLTTLKTVPAELELVSAMYQALKLLREQVPFTLTVQSGELLMSYSKDEFIIADEFQGTFHVFERVLEFERRLATESTLNRIQAGADLLAAKEQLANAVKQEQQSQNPA